MDLRRERHYVAGSTMEWLLILSAMLSALTGAFGGARDAEPQVQRSETASIAAATVEGVEEAALPAAPFVLAAAPEASEPPALAAATIPVPVALETVRLIE